MTIKLHSQRDPDDPDDPENNQIEIPNTYTNKPEEKEEKDGEFETAYEKKMKYRIDYFVKGDRKGDPEKFVESRIYDDPITLEALNSRVRVQTVLEEIKTVTLGSQRALRRKDKVSKDSLKLGVDIADVVGANKLHIRSPLLLNVLRSIVKYSSNPPGGNNDVFVDGVFTYPFEDLYHHRQELLDYKNDNTGPRANHTAEYNVECDRHIDILIEYLENEPSIQLDSVKVRWDQKVPTTTFATFWLLMKPGTDVYVQENGQLNAYVIDLVSGGIDYSSGMEWSSQANPYFVRVWNLVYDGKTIYRMSRTIEMPVFDGERDIMSLPLFPTRFHDQLDGGALRKQLVVRGLKFFQYTKKPTFLEYTGLGLKPGWRKVSSSVTTKAFGNSLALTRQHTDLLVQPNTSSC
jgi:hypothetical protein